MSKTSIRDARHYSWGAACDGWHLLEGEDLSVIEERLPPNASETRHRHARARQFFYVLAGNATLEVEGRRLSVQAGEGVHVPPGAAHQVRNDGTADLRMLVISAPMSHGDRSEAPA